MDPLWPPPVHSLQGFLRDRQVVNFSNTWQCPPFCLKYFNGSPAYWKNTTLSRVYEVLYRLVTICLSTPSSITFPLLPAPQSRRALCLSLHLLCCFLPLDLCTYSFLWMGDCSLSYYSVNYYSPFCSQLRGKFSVKASLTSLSESLSFRFILPCTNSHATLCIVANRLLHVVIWYYLPLPLMVSSVTGYLCFLLFP